MSGIKGILFDKDGTLVDFDRTWSAVGDLMAMKAADGDRRKADRLLDKAGYDFGARRFRADSVFAAGTNADIIALWYPELAPGERQAVVAGFERFVAESGAATPYPLAGVKDAVARLHAAGYRLAVVTNDSTGGAEQTLATLGMAQLFDAAYGYDAVATPKPAPDAVLAFCDMAGLQPRQVAMVGDNRHDLAMARAAGCGLAVGVLSGTGTRETLAPLADAILGSVAELPDFLTEGKAGRRLAGV